MTTMTRGMMICVSAFAVLSCGGEPRAGTEREDIGNGLGFYFDPEIAADGRLAFATIVDGKGAIFVADADGKNARRVSFGTWDYTPVWSPTGEWIAFGRDANGGDVVIVPSDSGAERIVASTPSSDGAIGWTADGTGLIYATATPAGEETWIYHLATGVSEKFIKIGGRVVGFPSPDDNVVGYLRFEGDKSTIWVWDRASDTHRQLTTEGFENLARRPFSPDGRSIVYTSTRSGTSDIWRADVATGALTQLTRDVGFDGLPKWSPDGSRILFESDRGGQPDVWVLTSGEEDVQRVTDDAIDEATPTWSPDGRNIVINAPTGFSHAYVVPLDGTPAVARTAGEFEVIDVNVSTDGKLIVYSGTKNGDADIWAVGAVEGESRLVSAAPGSDAGVRLSPDALQIAFTSQRSGSSDIWVVPAAGGTARRLTDWPSNEFDARWSRDGKRLFFRSNRQSRGADLWVVDAAGGAPTRLTTLGTLFGYTQSPDGRSLLLNAETAASGGLAVFVLPVSGGSPRLLARAHTQAPVWSRDGREVALQHTADGYGVIEVHSASGGLLRKLSLEDRVYEFPVGWTLDGSRMVVMYQDLYSDGSQQLAIQPSGGGARTPLAPGARFSVVDFAFAREADVLVAARTPAGRLLLKIPVP